MRNNRTQMHTDIRIPQLRGGMQAPLAYHVSLELASHRLLVASEDEAEELRKLAENVRLEVHRESHAARSKEASKHPV